METLIKNFKQVLVDFLFPRKPLDITAENLCQSAKRVENWDEKDTVVLFDYHDTLPKKLIWELKYKNNDQAAKILAEAMYAEMLLQLGDWLAFENFEKPILIPTPISKEKLQSRGYNQIEMLISEILKLDTEGNLTSEFEVVKKKKDTLDQSSLKTKSDRMKNLKDAFRVSTPSKIKGRNIILIDDVVTTGSTIKEIKKVLKKSGAKKVKAFVVAH